MNRRKYISLLAVAGLFFCGGAGVAQAEERAEMVGMINEAIVFAEAAVEQVRLKIETGKQQLALIPEGSELYDEVTQVIAAASGKWKAATAALDMAKKSASRILLAKSNDLARDYALLARVHAGVALSGAKVLETGLIFVDAAASNKTEALGIIRKAMRASLNSAAQVQSSCDRIMKLIAEKRSAS